MSDLDPALAPALGPGGVTLVDVWTDTGVGTEGEDSRLLTVALELFDHLFPHYARDRHYVRACSRRRSAAHPLAVGHVWLVRDGDEYVGLQVFNYLFRRGLGFGAFRGLLASHQGRGLGAWLIGEALGQLQRDAARYGGWAVSGHCVEVPVLESAGQRREFARKTGGIVLEADYLEPPMVQSPVYARPEDVVGILPKPMQLVFYPSGPRSGLSLVETVNVVEAVYLDEYLLSPDSPLLARALASLGQQDRSARRPSRLPSGRDLESA